MEEVDSEMVHFMLILLSGWVFLEVIWLVYTSAGLLPAFIYKY